MFHSYFCVSDLLYLNFSVLVLVFRLKSFGVLVFRFLCFISIVSISKRLSFSVSVLVCFILVPVFLFQCFDSVISITKFLDFSVQILVF